MLINVLTSHKTRMVTVSALVLLAGSCSSCLGCPRCGWGCWVQSFRPRCCWHGTLQVLFGGCSGCCQLRWGSKHTKHKRKPPHLHTCILVLPKLILFLPNGTKNLLVACKYKTSPLDRMGLLVESQFFLRRLWFEATVAWWQHES